MHIPFHFCLHYICHGDWFNGELFVDADLWFTTRILSRNGNERIVTSCFSTSHNIRAEELAVQVTVPIADHFWGFLATVVHTSVVVDFLLECAVIVHSAHAGIMQTEKN